MSQRVWNKGRPPHKGWWNASIASELNPEAWRWWNGITWSRVAWAETGRSNAIQQSKRPHGEQYGSEILWTDYWPKDARVPRVRP